MCLICQEDLIDYSKSVVFEGDRVGKLWSLKHILINSTDPEAAFGTNLGGPTDPKVQIIHEQFNHAPLPVLKDMCGRGDLDQHGKDTRKAIMDCKFIFCKACKTGKKIPRPIGKGGLNHEYKPFEKVSFDTAGPFLGGHEQEFKYYTVYVDHGTNFSIVFSSNVIDTRNTLNELEKVFALARTTDTQLKH